MVIEILSGTALAIWAYGIWLVVHEKTDKQSDRSLKRRYK